MLDKNKFVSAYLKEGKESLFDANFSTILNEPIDFESVIGIPIMNQEKVSGFVICLHENPYFFSFDDYKLMQSLIGHSSLALANSMLRDQLRELANKDHLTKLYARRFLEKAMVKSLKEEEAGVLLLLDIDNFKQINDTYGHEGGDQVLRQVSSFLLSKVAGKGIAARWGGEELAVYLPNISAEEGEIFANQLIESIPFETDPSVTVSGGLKSWSSKRRIRFQDLFHYADKALYVAKNNGKNQIVNSERLSLHH